MTAPTAKDLLDDAADRAVAGLAVDPRAVLAAAGERRRTAVARRAVLVAASVAALLVVALSMLPVVQRAAPQPADRPDGPGGIPRTLYLPPPWTPGVTEQPISRAVYVASAPAATGSEQEAGVDVPTPPDRPWLVGADGGQYRLLPERVDDGSVALSPQGAVVAWTGDGRYGSGTRVGLVDVRTGARRDVDLAGSFARGLRVESMVFSPDGRALAVTGFDRPGAGAAGVRVLFTVDVATGTVTRNCRVGETQGFPAALGWTGAGDAIAVEGGCGTLFEASGPNIVAPGPGPQDASSGSGLGPPALRSAGPAVAPDGRTRVDVAQAAEDGPLRLVTTRRDPVGATDATVGRDVPLDGWTHAAALAVTDRGVVVSRWNADPTYPSGQFGPADVALVDTAQGRVEVLSAVDGVVPRVVAVAADVVAGGTPVDGVAPGSRVVDVAWWSWWTRAVLGTVLGWVGGLPLAVWALLAAAGYLAVARRIPVPVRTTGLVVGAVAVLGWLVLPFVVPDVAAPAPRPATDRAVLPRVLDDVRLIPPRAFDTPGEPRTRAVGVLYAGELGGRQGLYGTDAATGTWVRLDDVPGVDSEALTFEPNGAVSPNGRFVLVGFNVVDLQTASARAVDLETGGSGVMTSGISTMTAVLDDGTVVAAPADGEGTLRVVVPGADRAGIVDAVTNVSSLQAQSGRTVLVRYFASEDSTTRAAPLTALVDLATAPPRVTAVPGVGQTEPAAVAGTTLVTLTGVGVVARIPWEAAARGPSDDVVVGQFGGTDAVWLASPSGSGPLVTLGVAPGGARLAVVRTPLDQRAPWQPEALTRIELGRDENGALVDLQGILTLAPGVVARASLVDVPAEPWWSWIQERIR